jgi:subtilase family serine protease
MTTRTHRRAALGTTTLVVAFVLVCAQAMAGETVSPLPPSAYTVSRACPAPAPGHAACLALELIPRTAAATAHTNPIGMTRAASSIPSAAPSPKAGQLGLRPQDLHSAYDLPDTVSSTQTLALVDAYNDPTAEADLESYDSEFGLPKCTRANGCFEQVNQEGQASPLPFPQTTGDLATQRTLCEKERSAAACVPFEEAEGWSVEISLDVETAHATCQNCQIALVEASTTEYKDFEQAEDAAVGLGAGEISNSWGGAECVDGDGCVWESPAFNHPGVVIAAAAGDDGYLNWLAEPQSPYPNFPADLPQVVAVGGTRLKTLGPDGEWTGESVWNDGGESEGEKEGYGAGGGGCSTQFTAQPWQQEVSDWTQVGCGSHRAVADVAADGDPYSGVAVYDSSESCKTKYGEKKVLADWCTIGGTSLASPLVAATFALAGGAHGVRYPARTLYENAAKSPGSLHDVTVGSNGECTLPFDEDTGLTGCGSAQEASTSCSSHLICLAGAGYDGPTGVGTPDGIAAFEAPAGAASEEGSGEASEESSGKTSASAASATTPATTSTVSTVTTSAVTTTPTVQLTGLALTVNALIALNKSRPKIAALAFTFTLNLAARVRTALEERVGRRGHQHWKTMGHTLTIAALGGVNRRRLSGNGVLGPGAYRLTLTPAGGTSRSLSFKIG